MRAIQRPKGALRVALAVVSLTFAGCGLGGSDGDDDQAAADAATSYFEDLTSFSAALEKATRPTPPTTGPAKRIRKLGQKSASDLGRALESAPELEELDTDEPSYADARAVAERIDPMLEELSLYAGYAYERGASLGRNEYNDAVRFSAGVIKRSTDHLFEAPSAGLITDKKKLATMERKFDLRAMADELRAWERYRRELANVEIDDPLVRSNQDYMISEVDLEIDIFEEYREHLRKATAAQLEYGYYDLIWPDEQPFRFAPGTIFSSGGPAYFKSLFRGERIIDSLAGDISKIADDQEVTADSPFVGDAYRKAILAGFVSPLSKPTANELQYQVSFRAWMLWRIREIEDTPDEAYEDARNTLMLEVITDGETRNNYDNLFTAFQAYNEQTYPVEPFEADAFVAMVKFLEEQLADPVAPILETTRTDFIAALGKLDFDSFEEGFLPSKDIPLGKLDDVFDAEDRALKSRDRVLDQLTAVMRRGAKKVDSPKKLKAALEKTLGATRPELPSS